MELFPTIVSNARTIDVLACGMSGTRSGSLLLVMICSFVPSIDTKLLIFLVYNDLTQMYVDV